MRSDVAAFLTGPLPPEAPFGLVFADPPYTAAEAEIETLVSRLGAPGWLSPGAMVSIERPRGSAVTLPAGLRSGWERGFGDTLVLFVEASDSPN